MVLKELVKLVALTQDLIRPGQQTLLSLRKQPHGMLQRADIPEYAEDAAILRFYQLDTLEPEVWVDQVSGQQNEDVRESTLQQFSRRVDGQAPEVNRFSMFKEPDIANDLEVLDDSDPLGIRETIFEK